MRTVNREIRLIIAAVENLQAALKIQGNRTIDATPEATAYVVSFVYVAIYWNNHHHLMHLVKRVNGWILWANMGLLFWLSLIPFATGWMGENEFATLPVVVYGFNLTMAAFAYYFLERALIAAQGKEGRLKMAVGGEIKGWTSIVVYVVGIIAALLWTPWIGLGCYALVALMWLVPDRRIERVLHRAE